AISDSSLSQVVVYASGATRTANYLTPDEYAYIAVYETPLDKTRSTFKLLRALERCGEDHRL
ncbi:Hypothetical predicted protein, partial [Olea europaea subsp. europaea]